MASPSLKDKSGGHTRLTTTTTLAIHGTEAWLFDADHEPSFVAHTSDQADHRPTPDTAIDTVLRPPNWTTTHSPQPRIADSVDSYFLSHR
jgi:hypothetical protein